MKTKIKTLLFTLLVTISFCNNIRAEKDSSLNILSIEYQKLRYNTINFLEENQSNNNVEADYDSKIDNEISYKSPTKAFFYSLVLPGLGQYYNGNRTKPYVFLGIEVVSWIYHIKWHTDGNDITDEFEAFNRAHWLQNRYEDYLRWNYEGIDDDDLIDAPEISHHLPDTRTQQYYEMTGKYDQFSWGWVDAIYNDSTWDDYSSTNPPPKIVGYATTPQSILREQYEIRRNDANNMYDRARRMMYVAFINRVVSAFEAMIASKKINKKIKATESFSSIKLDTKFKSYYSLYDTPVLTFKLNF